jgi:hypothetical protein
LQNGFFIRQVGPVFAWIAEINFMRFALNTFYYNEFVGQVYNCTNVTCSFPTGEAVLVSLNVPLDLEIWFDLFFFFFPF